MLKEVGKACPALLRLIPRAREDQDVEDALDKVDDKLQWAIYACALEYDVEDYEVFLTGKGKITNYMEAMSTPYCPAGNHTNYSLRHKSN